MEDYIIDNVNRLNFAGSDLTSSTTTKWYVKEYQFTKNNK